MKKRIKKRTKSWEKIFVTISIIAIIVIIGIYAYRTIYYYKKTNYTSPDAKLLEIITNQMDVVYSGDGLYKDKDTNNQKVKRDREKELEEINLNVFNSKDDILNDINFDDKINLAEDILGFNNDLNLDIDMNNLANELIDDNFINSKKPKNNNNTNKNKKEKENKNNINKEKKINNQKIENEDNNNSNNKEEDEILDLSKKELDICLFF